MVSAIVHVDDNSFDRVILNGGNRYKLIKFWADWCAPCATLSPIVEQLCDKYKDHIDFYKFEVLMNSDSRVVEKNDIKALPTIVVFKNGKEVNRKMGMVKKDDLDSWLQTVISSE